MGCIGWVAGTAVIGFALVGSGCAADGDAEYIGDLNGKSLTVTHGGVVMSDGLKVALDYEDLSRCTVLRSDAFARLNGSSVPLSVGLYQVVPPMGDEGGFNCTHPSVTLDQIPDDVPPPWTVEIGDSSETVSVTFEPGTPNPVQVGPLTGTTLTSSQDELDVPIQRQADDTTPGFAAATFTASDGQSSMRAGDLFQTYIRFRSPIDPGWPAGQVSAQIDLSYYPTDALLACRNARCSITPMPTNCIAVTATNVAPCAELHPVSDTTVLTFQLDCASANGLCN
jgi:hypothetical protein